MANLYFLFFDDRSKKLIDVICLLVKGTAIWYIPVKGT